VLNRTADCRVAESRRHGFLGVLRGYSASSLLPISGETTPGFL
jgi:hypothetical protein